MPNGSEQSSQPTFAGIALGEAASRYVVDSASNGILIADAQQPDNPVVYVNPAFERITGYSAQEVIGRNCRFLQGSERDQPGLDEVRAALREQRDTRVVVRNYRKDGGAFWNELILTPMRDDTGTVTHFIGIQSDITARVDAQQQLTESEEMFRQLAEHIREVFWLLDWTDHSVLYCSPAYEEIWGRPVQALYDHSDDWIDMIHEEDRERVREVFFALAAEGAYDEVYRIVRPDGSIRWIRDRGFPVGGPGGEITRVAGIAEDISELVRWERSVRATEKLAATGRMAARVAHEINNPLAGIKNSFHLVRDAIPSGHSCLKYADLIEREVDRIAAIVRQMFELHGSEGVQEREFALQRTIREVATLALPRRGSREVELALDLPDQDLRVFLPESQLRQILFNLIHNAIEASPDGGEVNVALKAHPDRFSLHVSDQGSGVAPEHADRIFEPFFTTKEGGPGGGLGLGLSVSRTLAETMGGHLQYAPGEPSGSIFELSLPLRPLKLPGKLLNNGSTDSPSRNAVP